MQTIQEKKSYGGLAFLPLLVFLILYVGCGLVFTALGHPEPFHQFPRHVALLAGLGCALLFAPSKPIAAKVDIFCKNAGNPDVMMIALIYLLAGGFQGAAEAIGGKDSLVNLGLSFVPEVLLIPGIFLISCGISTAIGTSMGTIAAVGPVAASVAQGAGLNLPLTCAAVIGGAYFGDNLSMISDTTISAARGCGSSMKDKFKTNFFIACPAALIACLLFGLFGGAGSISEIGSYNLLQVLPYLAVLVAALLGVHVVLVLLLGITLTGVIGIAQGTLDFFAWAKAIEEGMSGMFSITLVAILVAGLIGIVRFFGGDTWLAEKLTSRIRGRRGAQYSLGLLSGILAAALSNNVIAIIISAPIAKDIGKQYDIPPRRLASLIDIFACAFLSLMPYDGGMLIMMGLTGTHPVEIIQYSFYPFLLILITCLTIHLNLFKPDKQE